MTPRTLIGAVLLGVLTWAAAPDASRVERGRLIVEPFGLSFQIPTDWLTKPTPLGGNGCDPHSAHARSVNTDAADLRSLTGPDPYFADQYYSAFADSLFAPSDLTAHLGAHGWRHCDNSAADLQMRVYVTSASPREIQKRMRAIRLSPYPGYSQPKVAAAWDSAGWTIHRADWVFNCGDCIFRERFEVYSRRSGGRTASLVFMYTPAAGWEKPPDDKRFVDLRAILGSITLK